MSYDAAGPADPFAREHAGRPRPHSPPQRMVARLFQKLVTLSAPPNSVVKCVESTGRCHRPSSRSASLSGAVDA